MTSRLILVFAGLGVIVLAGLSTMQELSVQQASAGADSHFFNNAAAAPLPIPLSSRGADLLLQRCSSVVAGLYGALQPPEMSDAARGHCLDLAQSLTTTMPSYALGWYTSAQLSYALGYIDQANQSLTLSQQTGRHEQYLAEARVQLAEDNRQNLTAAALEGNDADLTLLAQSGRGVRSIAARYVSAPDFRERITVIVEALPPEEQRRFLANVRQAAQRYGMVPSNQ